MHDAEHGRGDAEVLRGGLLDQSSASSLRRARRRRRTATSSTSKSSSSSRSATDVVGLVLVELVLDVAAGCGAHHRVRVEEGRHAEQRREGADEHQRGDADAHHAIERHGLVRAGDRRRRLGSSRRATRPTRPRASLARARHHLAGPSSTGSVDRSSMSVSVVAPSAVSSSSSSCRPWSAPPVHQQRLQRAPEQATLVPQPALGERHAGIVHPRHGVEAHPLAGGERRRWIVRSGLMNSVVVQSVTLLMPLPKSAAAATRCSGDGVSPCDDGHAQADPVRGRLRTRRSCRRRSGARRRGCGSRPSRPSSASARRPSPVARAAAARSRSAVVSGASTAAVRIRSSRAVATTVPSAVASSASTSWTLRPARTTTAPSPQRRHRHGPQQLDGEPGRVPGDRRGASRRRRARPPGRAGRRRTAVERVGRPRADGDHAVGCQPPPSTGSNSAVGSGTPSDATRRRFRTPNSRSEARRSRCRRSGGGVGGRRRGRRRRRDRRRGGRRSCARPRPGRRPAGRRRASAAVTSPSTATPADGIVDLRAACRRRGRPRCRRRRRRRAPPARRRSVVDRDRSPGARTAGRRRRAGGSRGRRPGGRRARARPGARPGTADGGRRRRRDRRGRTGSRPAGRRAACRRRR